MTDEAADDVDRPAPFVEVPVGPDTGHMHRLLRLLDRTHDDGKVRDALGRAKPLTRDLLSGEVLPAFHYRLQCGHLVVVWTRPLPDYVLDLYCETCTPPTHRDIVERLTLGDE